MHMRGLFWYVELTLNLDLTIQYDYILLQMVPLLNSLTVK